jgi:hypothetical protein
MPEPTDLLTSTIWTDGIGRLTIEALEAAERGDWDRVSTCYDARRLWFKNNFVMPNLAHALLAMDETIMARARVAQAALHQLLVEAATARSRWKSLSSTIANNRPVGGQLDRHS